jgi:hypothetical protein
MKQGGHIFPLQVYIPVLTRDADGPGVIQNSRLIQGIDMAADTAQGNGPVEISGIYIGKRPFSGQSEIFRQMPGDDAFS